MAESKKEEKQSFRVEITPRRPSFTSRLIGANREWLNNYYQSQEEDDQQYGHGFNDQADDFIPGVLYNRRRRNSSVSSDASTDSVGQERIQRTGSISERVAGMQVITEANQQKPLIGGTGTTGKTNHKIGDIQDYSVLF